MIRYEDAQREYHDVTRELSDLYQELGELNGAEIEASVSAYDTALHEGGSTTECRHASSVASKHFKIEIVKTQGRIDALLIRLRFLDQFI